MHSQVFLVSGDPGVPTRCGFSVKSKLFVCPNPQVPLWKPSERRALDSPLFPQPSVDDYMGVVKRSPSPPDACRNQLLPEWWVQQPSAGEDRPPGDRPARGGWQHRGGGWRRRGDPGTAVSSVLRKVTSHPSPLPLRKARGPCPGPSPGRRPLVARDPETGWPTPPRPEGSLPCGPASHSPRTSETPSEPRRGVGPGPCGRSLGALASNPMVGREFVT